MRYQQRSKRYQWAAAALAAMVVVTMSAASAQAAAAGEIHAASSTEAIPGRYVVVLRASVAGDVGTATAEAAMPALANQLVGRYGGQVRDVWSTALTGFSMEMTQRQAARLAADPAVAYVEQEQVYRSTHHGSPCTAPSSFCQLSAPRNLDHIDQRVKPFDGTFHLPNRGERVDAYVIDTGVRLSHIQFVLHIANRAIWGTNTIDGNNTDCNGHGTHVAGTLAGEIWGVAKSSRIIAVKVLDCLGNGTTASVIGGVDWVASHANMQSQPAVANMSLGGPASTAIDNAVQNSALGAGVFYAIAAGNSNQNACDFSPARASAWFLGIVTVGSTDQSGRRSSFSNWGSCVDIFAGGNYGDTTFNRPNCPFMPPGTTGRVVSAGHSSNTAECVASGTSMATPLVAGAAALLANDLPPSVGGPPAWAQLMLLEATTGWVTDPRGSPNRFLFIDSNP